MTGGDDEVALTPGWVTRVKCDFTAVLWASRVFFSLVFAASDWIWVRGGGVVGLEVQKSRLPLQSWWGKASFPFCSPLMRVFVSLSTLFFSRWLLRQRVSLVIDFGLICHLRHMWLEPETSARWDPLRFCLASFHFRSLLLLFSRQRSFCWF